MNIEGLIRNVREEKAMRLLLKQVMDNNVMILKLQKQVLELQEVENQKKKERIGKRMEEREYSERWKEKEQKRRKKERRKKIDDE